MLFLPPAASGRPSESKVASDHDGRLLLFEEGFGWKYPADSKMGVAEAIHSMNLHDGQRQNKTKNASRSTGDGISQQVLEGSPSMTPAAVGGKT